MNLNEEAQRVHKLNMKWWLDLETGELFDRNLGELLMLCISELSESLEGYRTSAQDSHLPHRRAAEVELADYLIRVLDIFGGMNWTFAEHVSYRPRVSKNFPEALLTLVGLTYEVWKENFVREWSHVNLEIAVAHLFDIAVVHALDIVGAYEEKLEYNRTRLDHQITERMKVGGKKF